MVSMSWTWVLMRICGLRGRETEEEALGDDVELGGMVKMRCSVEESWDNKGGGGLDSSWIFAHPSISVGIGISAIR